MSASEIPYEDFDRKVLKPLSEYYGVKATTKAIKHLQQYYRKEEFDPETIADDWIEHDYKNCEGIHELFKSDEYSDFGTEVIGDANKRVVFDWICHWLLSTKSTPAQTPIKVIQPIANQQPAQPPIMDSPPAAFSLDSLQTGPPSPQLFEHVKGMIQQHASQLFQQNVHSGARLSTQDPGDKTMIWMKCFDVLNNLPILSMLWDTFSRVCMDMERVKWPAKIPRLRCDDATMVVEDEFTVQMWCDQRAKEEGTFFHRIEKTSQEERNKLASLNPNIAVATAAQIEPTQYIKDALNALQTRLRWAFNFNYGSSPTIHDRLDTFAKITCAMNRYLHKRFKHIIACKNDVPAEETAQCPLHIDLVIIPALTKKDTYLEYDEKKDCDSASDSELEGSVEYVAEESESRLLHFCKSGSKGVKQAIWNIEELLNDTKSYIKGRDYVTAETQEMNFDALSVNRIEDILKQVFEDKGMQLQKEKRYLLVVDRRNPENIAHQKMTDYDDTTKKPWLDRIYLIEIKNKTFNGREYRFGDICTEHYALHLNECFISNTIGHLLPMSGTQDDPKKDFTGSDAGNGYKFVISYHIYHAHKVKMYWNIHQSMMRFFINDIEWLWPRFFNPSDEKQPRNQHDSFQTLDPDTHEAVMDCAKEYELRDGDFEQWLVTEKLFDGQRWANKWLSS